MSDETDPADERHDEASATNHDDADSFAELEDVDGDSDPFAELEDVDDGSDPFAELDDAPLGERTPATDDDLFEEMDRNDLEAEDEVVERVLDGERVTALDPDADDVPSEGAEAEATAARDEVVVPKRRYCEGCQYFSAPPETACEHPGTDILELVDTEHFLVADCPVVEWRRELEAYPDPGEASLDPRE